MHRDLTVSPSSCRMYHSPPHLPNRHIDSLNTGRSGRHHLSLHPGCRKLHLYCRYERGGFSVSDCECLANLRYCQHLLFLRNLRHEAWLCIAPEEEARTSAIRPDANPLHHGVPDAINPGYVWPLPDEIHELNGLCSTLLNPAILCLQPTNWFQCPHCSSGFPTSIIPVGLSFPRQPFCRFKGAKFQS